MTASTRFLGLAVMAWVGVRAVSLGIVPGIDLSLDRPAAAATTPPVGLPPIEPTEFAPIEPTSSAAPDPVVAMPPATAPSETTVRLVAARPVARPSYIAYPDYAASYSAYGAEARSPAAVRLARGNAVTAAASIALGISALHDGLAPGPRRLRRHADRLSIPNPCLLARSLAGSASSPA